MTWGEGDAKQRVTAEMLRGLGYGPPHSEGTAGLRGGGQRQSREGEGQTEAGEVGAGPPSGRLGPTPCLGRVLQTPVLTTHVALSGVGDTFSSVAHEGAGRHLCWQAFLRERGRVPGLGGHRAGPGRGGPGRSAEDGGWDVPPLSGSVWKVARPLKGFLGGSSPVSRTTR